MSSRGGERGRTSEDQLEVDEYEVLAEHDVDDDPPAYRPLGPGDVFDDIELAHLATPYRGPIIVVGHPCSLRRGLSLQEDIPVAPVAEPATPTAQHPHADRVMPVRKLIPPDSNVNRVVHLTRTTTLTARALALDERCAALTNAGVVALQQRVVGKQTRVKIPPRIIALHCRGPLTELELWTDWRERWLERADDLDGCDKRFDAFMRSPSGFGELARRTGRTRARAGAGSRRCYGSSARLSVDFDGARSARGLRLCFARNGPVSVRGSLATACERASQPGLMWSS